MTFAAARRMLSGTGLCLSLAAPALATADLGVPPEHTKGVVSYVSGGLGADQAAEMRRDALSFPLGLEFVHGKKVEPGMYLANVDVTIRTPSGRVLLSTRSEGPYLLATLPDGLYRISAEHAGRTETRSVNVEHGRHQMIVFDWAS